MNVMQRRFSMKIDGPTIAAVLLALSGVMTLSPSHVGADPVYQEPVMDQSQGGLNNQITAPSQNGTGTVKGDILDIEGEYFIIKDVTGHDMRLHVDKSTKTDGVPKVGEKIQAHVTKEGHATSITPLLPQESVTIPPPR
jgi:hypothetical protein